jgi:hypothetical protein
MISGAFSTQDVGKWAGSLYLAYALCISMVGFHLILPLARSSSSLLAFLRHSISSAAPPLRKDKRINMTENLGLQAASMVDEKIREFRCLQEELNTHRSDLGTLMAQRNENELVKQVGVGVHGHRSPFRFDCLISGAKTE